MSDQQSLQDYLKAKREARASKRATRMVIPVAGFEERFAGRYKILDFDAKRDIQQRHESIGEQGDGQELVNASADLIINSCEDLLEITGTSDDGKLSVQSLGKTWMAPDIAELFGVDIPPMTTAIQALRMVLDPDQIMEHFGRISAESAMILEEAQAETQGEALPSGEGSPT